MHKKFAIRFGAAFAAAMITGLGLAGPAARAVPVRAAAAMLPAGEAPACAAIAGQATCASLVQTSAASSTPLGYRPSDLQSAYGLATPELSNGATVAVVNAYNDKDVAGDLAAYRTQYGIAACTEASGCLKVVNQTGGSTLPVASAGWSVGTSQSVDVISAVCPSCHILLVEAKDSSLANLETAEDTAASLGAKFITNTWVFPEVQIGASEPSNDSHFDHPGVVITAPAGDSGFGTIEYPAASPDVIAVGGTTLSRDTSTTRGWSESVWPSTGSGCSEYETTKPAWQTDPDCADRMLNDVSAVADGVAYYDTDTNGGWSDSGGTVVSAAVIAAAYALGGPPQPATSPASYLYTHPSAFWNITGSNGTCTPAYWCTAGTGYNGPAGNGTPYSDVAFSSTGARPAVIGTTSYVRLTNGSIESAFPILLGGGTCGRFGCGNYANLGGSFSSYPAALAASNGSTWLFAVGGGNLYANELLSGAANWSGWTSLGAPSGRRLLGTPAAVQDKSGAIRVFVRDSSVGNAWQDVLPSGGSTWSGFSDLAGLLPNDLSAVVNNNGSIVLMGCGNNSQLYYDELPSGGSWSGWTHIAGATVTGVPAITKDNSGTDRVFVRQSSNGAVLQVTLANGGTAWSGFTNLGGTILTFPTTLTGADGTVWLFVLGTNSSAYLKSLPSGGSWTASWTDVGGSLSGMLGFAKDAQSVFHLYARGAGGDLQENHIPSGSATWQGWASFGSLFTLAGS